MTTTSRSFALVSPNVTTFWFHCDYYTWSFFLIAHLLIYGYLITSLQIFTVTWPSSLSCYPGKPQLWPNPHICLFHVVTWATELCVENLRFKNHSRYPHVSTSFWLMHLLPFITEFPLPHPEKAIHSFLSAHNLLTLPSLTLSWWCPLM